MPATLGDYWRGITTVHPGCPAPISVYGFQQRCYAVSESVVAFDNRQPADNFRLRGLSTAAGSASERSNPGPSLFSFVCARRAYSG